MNDVYVTKRAKFHWKDLKHVINFVDNLTEIEQRMNAGFWMGLIRPMVHTLNTTNCVHKALVKSLGMAVLPMGMGIRGYPTRKQWAWVRLFTTSYPWVMGIHTSKMHG